MFFFPLSLPRKEIPGLDVLFPGERGIAGERDQRKSQWSWKKSFCVSVVYTWSEPDAVRPSQLGLWQGWNKQFFCLTASRSPSLLVSHHSDRLQRGMLIGSRPQAAAGRAMLTTPCAAAPTAGATSIKPCHVSALFYVLKVNYRQSQIWLWTFKQRVL